MTTTEPPPVRVVLCMPSNRRPPIETVGAYAEVYGHGLLAGLVTSKMEVGDTYIDTARNLLVTHAMDVPTQPTHILWLDDDMVWPSDTVARLVAHDLPIVGGLYFQRMPPFHPVAYTRLHERDGDRRGQFLTLPDDPTGLVEVDGMGLGCCLVRMDVYFDLAERGGPRWHAVIDGRGEDLHFFDRALDAGYQPMLDTDLQCGHVRDEVVQRVHYETFRRSTAAGPPSD
jgi:hypothetical protein